LSVFHTARAAGRGRDRQPAGELLAGLVVVAELLEDGSEIITSN